MVTCRYGCCIDWEACVLRPILCPLCVCFFLMLSSFFVFLSVSVTGKNDVGIPMTLLHDCEGCIATIEMKRGDSYRGYLSSIDDDMNVVLQDVTKTDVTGEYSNLEMIFLRGLFFLSLQCFVYSSSYSLAFSFFSFRQQHCLRRSSRRAQVRTHVRTYRHLEEVQRTCSSIRWHSIHHATKFFSLSFLSLFNFSL